MKYNPRVNEEAAAQPGFTQLHPLQPVETVQGALEVLATAERLLCEITGMDGMSLSLIHICTVEFVAAMPKTISGKIRKTELRT